MTVSQAEVLTCSEVSPLCNLDPAVGRLPKTSNLYLVEPEFCIIDCLDCHIPMLVWWRCEEPTEDDKAKALVLARRLFDRPLRLRGTRKNYAHPHEHLVDEDVFTG